MSTQDPEPKPTPGRSRRGLLPAAAKIALGPILAGIVGIVVAEPVKEWWSGPRSYKVYLVGDFRPAQESSNQIRDGFMEKGNPQVKIDGAEIEIDVREDEGDPGSAAKVAAELAADDSTLLIVGHLSSTETKAAMPQYLGKADPPVPMLLAAETNPELYLTSAAEWRDEGAAKPVPVFRLPPTDDRQASDAAAFAISQGASSFWVVEDGSNPVYSKFLSGEFIRSVQEQNKSVLLAATNPALPSLDVFRVLKPNCVFFAGSTANALILIRQIRAISKNVNLAVPTVIVSDSAVGKALISQGGSDVEGVYGVYPIPASQYSTGDEGFKSVGRDARAVLDALLADASRRFAQIRRERGGLSYWLRWIARIHRVGDSRLVIASLMDRAIREKRVFELSGSRKAQFTSDMRNQAARFYLWQVRDGKFQDVP